MTCLGVALLALVLLAVPPAASAQHPGPLKRIVIFTYPPQPVPAPPSPWVDAFRQALRELGWIDGENVRIERRSTDRGRLDELAAQVVREKVDLIVTNATPAALAAKKATTTIPIVMAVSADPVSGGVVDRIARPGGNVTGMTLIGPDVAGKRLELLKEMVPRLTRVAVIHRPGAGAFPVIAEAVRESREAAQALGLTLTIAEVDGPDRWGPAFDDLKRQRVGAVALTESPVYTLQAHRIAEAAIRHRLPAIFPFREFVDAGGLMSYGANVVDLWRRSAALVDKILRGTPPGELPVEQPTRFELVVNSATARALGLTIPRSVLLRADEVLR